MKQIFKSQIAMLLVWALVCLSVPMMTGCTSKTPVEIAQDAVTGFTLGKTYVADARALLPQITTLNPELAKIVDQFSTIADQNLDSLIKLGNAYVALPSGDTYQALLNGVDAIVATVNASVLSVAKVTNPDSQAKVLAVMTVAASILQGVLVLLKQKANAAQLKAVPKIAGRIEFKQIKPYLNREYARQQLKSRPELRTMGYSADDILQTAGF